MLGGIEWNDYGIVLIVVVEILVFVVKDVDYCKGVLLDVYGFVDWIVVVEEVLGDCFVD